MCEQKNLIAWLDGELDTAEADAVREHVVSCGQCTERVRAFREVSQDVQAYMLVAPAAIPAQRTRLKWAGVAAAAAIAATILVSIFLRPHDQEHKIAGQQIVPNPVREVMPEPPRVAQPVVPRKRRIRHAVPVAPVQSTEYSEGPVIRVAIPADQLFAPGAVPAGVEIFADMALAPDGSIRELRVLP